MAKEKVLEMVACDFLQFLIANNDPLLYHYVIAIADNADTLPLFPPSGFSEKLVGGSFLSR